MNTDIKTSRVFPLLLIFPQSLKNMKLFLAHRPFKSTEAHAHPAGRHLLPRCRKLSPLYIDHSKALGLTQIWDSG